MKTKEITKKLEEVRAKLYDGVTSSEEKSPIQVGDDSMLPIDDDLAGEEVKIERTKGEKVKDIVTLSRATSMDGKSNTDESVYVTDGTLKALTMDELQKKLDVLKALKAYEMSDEEHWEQVIVPLMEKIESNRMGDSPVITLLNDDKDSLDLMATKNQTSPESLLARYFDKRVAIIFNSQKGSNEIILE